MKFIVACLPLLVLVSAYIDDDEEMQQWAMENPDLFLGDILEFEPEDRNVVAKLERRWPNKTIPYVIDESLEKVTKTIKEAMDEYHTKTCLKFVPRSDEKNYIKIFKGQGCYSSIGMQNRGEQPVSLGTGCHKKGTMVHELGHTIGFYHEQNRSDRQDYVTIFWDNIKEGQEKQFILLKPTKNILYSEFDYHSIMIYGNYAFAKDKSKKTMEAKDGTPLLMSYKKKGLTKSDAERVNKMYNCKDIK